MEYFTHTVLELPLLILKYLEITRSPYIYIYLVVMVVSPPATSSTTRAPQHGQVGTATMSGHVTSSSNRPSCISSSQSLTSIASLEPLKWLVAGDLPPVSRGAQLQVLAAAGHRSAPLSAAIAAFWGAVSAPDM